MKSQVLNRASSEVISESVLKPVKNVLNEKTQGLDEMGAVIKIDNGSAIS